MIIIGEKINATRKQVASAIAARDVETIADLARSQGQAGANYLDVNGGDPSREVENMIWLLDVVQSAVTLPVSLDSANPQAIEAGLKRVKHKPLINSVSLEEKRLETFLPMIKDHDCSVMALLVNDASVPTNVEDRVERAEKLIGILTDAGKKLDEIFIDPCFLTIYTEPNAGLDLLEGIRRIRARWPQVHISGGISNASYGLPERRWINQAYLILAMEAGMDSAIIDPCSEGTIPLIAAAEVVLKKDEMGMNYIAAMRRDK